MLALGTSYQSHLDGEVTQLATCWKITRRDNVVLGFTDYAIDIVIGGVTYQSALGYSATDVQTSADLAVDNLELQGWIDSASVTEVDLQAGRWDYATVEIFECIPTQLSAGIRRFRRGRLGEASLGRSVFIAELVGLAQAFTRVIGVLTSPTCRNDLGDAACTVNLAALTVTGTVTTGTSARQWTDTARAEAAGYFAYGVVTWTSGLNTGFSMEIKTHTAGGVFGLALPMPYAIAAGDGYSMTPGCDKLLATCIAKYSNVLNFAGEPHLPGQDAVLRGPQ